ncbi:uncharacterized protein A1O9_06600 [Exophiala aquamarina CBS 119918]|uniref:Protein CMS1 n=1 Tax=Exophiala aquamarina CBS 119918 TaxID=1182545 RepID=A0A072PEW3_9EURO|nr:uncharacterized protein A1O9_06600 [Exophiala aquamarina CBS 119918]KEF58674.1 hypothetical protein A1O9_06600 [Exophiala aquamarina CBS 119918]
MARTKRYARKLTGSLKRRRDEEDLDERSLKKASLSQRLLEEQSDDEVPVGRPAFFADQFAKAIQNRGPSGRSPEDKDDAKHESTKKTGQTQRARTEYDEAIALMNPSLLADHFAKSIQKQFPDSSSLEREDLHLPTKAFRDTSGFDEAHIAPNLSSFLEAATENGKDALTHCEKGAGPHTLIITSSGIRTADLARELRVFNSTGCQVAKLIAKHMKLKANVEHMKNNRVGIAISTPMRLRDLVDAGALKLEHVKRIVVDGSYKDEKKRRIFEMNELFRPLVELLSRAELKQRYGTTNPVEIMVF